MLNGRAILGLLLKQSVHQLLRWIACNWSSGSRLKLRDDGHCLWAYDAIRPTDIVAQVSESLLNNDNLGAGKASRLNLQIPKIRRISLTLDLLLLNTLLNQRAHHVHERADDLVRVLRSRRRDQTHSEHYD
ncbi:MAG: hypothetical protein ABR929_01995 [Roseiarcus sp.]|jgi:hypothetical protein